MNDVLRRFELYRFAPVSSRVPGVPGDPWEGSTPLAEACRRCGHHIPEVLDSAVGINLSEAPVDLVWEHAFADAAAYRRYMVHPYHVVVLDRYLLADSPERVVADDTLGAGLVGYACTQPSYRTSGAVRRLVLLQVDREAPPDTVGELRNDLEASAHRHREVSLSVMASNSLGASWFDGEHPVGPPPRWTHVWEQAFAHRDAFDAYRAVASTVPAGADAGAWATWSAGLVRRVAEVFYEVQPGI